MPRIIAPLTDLQVKRIKTPGLHAVGGVPGLALQVRLPKQEGGPLSRSWILRVQQDNTRQLVGLGSYPLVSLAEAREAAGKLVNEAKSGVNLAAKKRAQKSALQAAAAATKTFEECAEAYMQAHSSDYRSEKHRKQWSSTLATYAYPKIGTMVVSDITVHDVMGVLLQNTEHRDGSAGPLWEIKTETATRLLDRIRCVLDYSIAAKYRTAPNPAIWSGNLKILMPNADALKKVQHHPAVPYSQIGDFMKNLRNNPSISARALEFLILTGVRSGSVRQANWSEIIFGQNQSQASMWIIPAEHTKSKEEEHRVPLAPQAVKLLQSLPKIATLTKIFPSPRGGELSDMALSELMRRMQERGELSIKAVPHGFRSTFRTWSAEQTNFPDDVRKASSGHKVDDAVKEAYERTDFFEKRRQLMLQWANFLDLPSAPEAEDNSSAS